MRLRARRGTGVERFGVLGLFGVRAGEGVVRVDAGTCAHLFPCGSRRRKIRSGTRGAAYGFTRRRMADESGRWVRDETGYGWAWLTPTYGYSWRAPLSQEAQRWAGQNADAYATPDVRKLLFLRAGTKFLF